jgi:hypothetical protein
MRQRAAVIFDTLEASAGKWSVAQPSCFLDSVAMTPA